MNTIQSKYNLSDKLLPIPSEKIPVKFTRNYQIILNQRPLSLKSIKKRDAELWKWTMTQTEFGRSDAMLRRAARALKTIQNIRTLYLIQWRSSITDAGLKHLCLSLKRHESLKSLYLCVGSCFSVGNKGLCDVGQSLKRLSRLETLDLSFPNNYQIIGKGILGLSKGMKALVNLRRFSLNFADNTVYAFGIKKLSGELKRLKRLESIDFNFSNCVKMTDKALKSIGEILEKNSDLQRVWLRFLNCPKPTNVGLKSLGESLEKLVSLEEVMLRFSGCKRTSDEGLERLAESLGKLKKLKEVNVWFSGCEMTKRGQNRAREALKEVKKVYLEVHIQLSWRARRAQEDAKKRLKSRIFKFGLMFLLVVLILTYFINFGLWSLFSKGLKFL